MVIETQIPLSQITWYPSWRIVSSRFPPIDLFERVASVDEFNIILEIESLTNPRIRDQRKEIDLVPKEDSVFGPGSSFIMAPFTHLSVSRFSDGTYGALYAGNSLQTAIAETKYHKEIFLRNFNSPKIELDMRVLLIDLYASLHDITEMRELFSDVYHPKDYSASQTLGRGLRMKGSLGIHYDSVRDPSGKCVAIFKPRALSNCRQERHLCYVWNGKEISMVYQKSEFNNRL